MSLPDKRGRVALVTGAARGIGRATVERLCLDEYHVIAIDSCQGTSDRTGVDYALATPQELDSLQRAYPSQVIALTGDVRDRDFLDSAAALAMERFGRLDAAVAAAAIILGGQSQWELSEEDLRLLLDVDVIGVWNTAAASIPAMMLSSTPHHCRFVAIASAAGEQGLFRLAGYNAAKHAVVGLVRGLAADLVGTGITAVAVSPGSTATAMLEETARIYGLDDPRDFGDSQLLRRLLMPQEIADTIAFCCSLSGGALNGSVVRATGGFNG